MRRRTAASLLARKSFARYIARLGATVTAAAVLFVAACNSTGDSPNDVSAPPTPAPTGAAVTPTPEDTSPPPPADIEFVYQAPDPQCAPVSAIDALNRPATGEYLQVDRLFQELDDRIKTNCRYRHADVPEEGEDTLLDDHVMVSSDITLFPEWGDSHWAGVYPELPLDSDRLTEWADIGSASGGGVWWEGCGSATPCDGGAEPTVQTHRRLFLFPGHVGNLEFYVHISYIAQEIPDDVRLRAAEVFRDLVLAEVERREKAE